MISHTDELPRVRRHQLFLIETRAPALDAIQFLIHLVCAVEGDVDQCVWWQGVEFDVPQPGRVEYLPRLVACGHEEGVREVVARGQGADGVDDVDDCAAAADPDVGWGQREVVCDGADGGGAFGGFDCVEGGGG